MIAGIVLFADGLRCSVACRPIGAISGWPLRPFHRQHALRAALNELRDQSLHKGLDIQARDGARVYAMQPGRAHIIQSVGADSRVQVGNFIYWHVIPRVREGALVRPFRLAVGEVLRYACWDDNGSTRPVRLGCEEVSGEIPGTIGQPAKSCSSITRTKIHSTGSTAFRSWPRPTANR